MVTWRDVLDGVDAVESWVAGVSYWVQVPVLLAVLLPLGWAAAGLIDRLVEKILWPYTRREMRFAAAASIVRNEAKAAGQAAGGRPTDDREMP